MPGQSQASLSDQLRELRQLADAAGLYDAADFIRDVVERGMPPAWPTVLSHPRYRAHAVECTACAATDAQIGPADGTCRRCNAGAGILRALMAEWNGVPRSAHRVYWIVSEGNDPERMSDGDFGVEVDGVPYFYYKDPDASPSPGARYRRVHKREFGEVIRLETVHPAKVVDGKA